ncbi:hypothetical protein NC652_009524 [Populus alba x Populus x berolinensis]|nr:hypothetical protein NC652_009524 [Populus alba x Populus x berolinensis]
MVHCKDKGKDLGVQYLSQKQQFHLKRDENRCSRKHFMWPVREDGFYSSNGNSNWNRAYQC